MPSKSVSTRPRYHFTPAFGWLNDPCAPGYDPLTDKYFLFHQWNPYSCEWGNMSWGAAVSPDLIYWHRRSGHEATPALAPDQPYDREGVFTGCLLPPTITTTTTSSEVYDGSAGSKSKLVVFYSSVCQLPFTWSKPYPRNAAGIAIAVSYDGGHVWEKSACNPILTGEPEHLEVTGFRDPSVGRWKAVDEVLGVENGLYGIINGGITGQGPNTFLYRLHDADHTRWEYIGPLLDLPVGYHASKWSGSFGVNLECTNFMTLNDGGRVQDFLITGSEGVGERPWQRSADMPPDLPRKTPRCCLWMAGSVVKRSIGGNTTAKDYPLLQRDFCGVLDHGCWYAASSFHDPKTDTRIVWGWIPEEEIPIDSCHAKGWNGCFGIPREIFLSHTDNVVGAITSPLTEMTNFKLSPDSNRTHVARTLGIRPLRQLATLRKGTKQIIEDTILAPASTSEIPAASALSCSFEVEVTISVSAPIPSKVGVCIHQNEHRLLIFFDSKNEELVIDRSKSNGNHNINKSLDKGPFTLLRLRDPHTNRIEYEKLRLRIFRDGDVLEVFANDRFALATMVYMEDDQVEGQDRSVSLFAEGGDGDVGGAIFDRVETWSEMDEIILSDE
ncbi:glycoside hydrolase family 32 protein [Polychaeton citri CBS 116435]|uniref:Glycoside hydrolase family 32 protein n=1 Tax=Polychaeton citri CBS 116435 TaxID=1314669 RepID=A0A9P4US64_9PEZI|nr:glycoside hydrolase family 32 protein [Polychaeton citri CBS 116435]